MPMSPRHWTKRSLASCRSTKSTCSTCSILNINFLTLAQALADDTEFHSDQSELDGLDFASDLAADTVLARRLSITRQDPVRRADVHEAVRATLARVSAHGEGRPWYRYGVHGVGVGGLFSRARAVHEAVRATLARVSAHGEGGRVGVGVVVLRARAMDGAVRATLARVSGYHTKVPCHRGS